VLATLLGAQGPLFWHESDAVTRYFPDSFWQGNSNLMVMISSNEKRKTSDNEFVLSRVHKLNYLRRGKPYIFAVSPGARFGVNIFGDFTTDPYFLAHRFVISGFCIDNPEAWLL
jgi:hypothetical protein